MTNTKFRLGNLIRFLSPGPPTTAARPEGGPFQYESQAEVSREYAEEQARQEQPAPSFALIPAEQSRLSLPPAYPFHQAYDPNHDSPYHSQEQYTAQQANNDYDGPCHTHETYTVQHNNINHDDPYHAQEYYTAQPTNTQQTYHEYYTQESYTPQQTYSSSATNPARPPYEPKVTGHVCRLCVATDRFPLRPTRCPFTGDIIRLPQSEQQPPIVTTWSMLQARDHRFERLEFVDVPAGIDDEENGDRPVRQREYYRAEWTGESTMDDTGDEYLSDRRRGIIKAWMDTCIERQCPGWEDERELDISGRGRWGEPEGLDGTREQSEGDAWRMLDNVWEGRG